MGKMKPLYQLQKQLQNRQAREQYYSNYQGPPEDTVLTPEGDATTVYYRSLHIVDGSDHRFFTSSVPEVTLQKVTAAQAGLVLVLPADTTSTPLRGSGVKPTLAHWYKGKTNPVYKSSPWGTKWAQYYESDAGKSHFSIPFSKATGVFDSADLMTAFGAVFAPGGNANETLLGTRNGRAYLELERYSTAIQN